jgi:16S rRNA (cytidine1402-2'-O)-methyltransferase
MLYVVGTPIGNLADITLRALETLRLADVVAAEDTRHSGNLLRKYEIHKPLVSFHAHNEARRTQELIAQLQAGRQVALITDAGLPGVSDPGARLVRACAEAGLPYTIIPGPSAVLTGLVGSGLPADRFYYAGFLPTKSGQRERELRNALERMETSVFFESPYRLVRTLEVCARLAPGRLLCVARELTKQFEEYRRGNGVDLLAHYQQHPPKGEITFVVAGRSKGETAPVAEPEDDTDTDENADEDAATEEPDAQTD